MVQGQTWRSKVFIEAVVIENKKITLHMKFLNQRHKWTVKINPSSGQPRKWIMGKYQIWKVYAVSILR